MRRLLAVVVGALGAAALVRRRRVRSRVHGEVEAAASPADELRVKLAESRAMAGERDEDEAGETPVDVAPDPGPDARRRDLHERARKTLDELQ